MNQGEDWVLAMNRNGLKGREKGKSFVLRMIVYYLENGSDRNEKRIYTSKCGMDGYRHGPR